MGISSKYYFSDFTLDNYKRILSIASRNYSFRFFNEEFIDKSIILRHDLEFSIPTALKMAQIEAEFGIKATYFVQLHSEFYNTLERASIISIKEISNLGHQIGLHFDTHFWNIKTERQLDKHLLIDKNIIEKYTGFKIKAFSFHNTTEFILSCRRAEYGGLINVYSDYYRDNYSYISDSLGFWRYERLENWLKEENGESLQLLVHDGLWQNDVLPPRRRIFKVIDDNANRLKSLYDNYLKKNGKKNIDWEGEL